MKYVLITLSILTTVGCTSGMSSTSTGGGSSTLGKIQSANLAVGAKGLVHVTGGVSSSSLSSGKPSSQNSLTDSLFQLKPNGDMSEVTFKVIDRFGNPVDTTVPVLGIKSLSDNFVALKIDTSRTALLNKATNDVYDLPLSPDEMMMDGTNLYYIINGNAYGTGQLLRVDLTDPLLETHTVNDVTGVASNTGIGPTSIASMLNDPFSPFKYLGIDEYSAVANGSYSVLSPSFIFAGPNFIAGMGGTGGSPTIMLFQEGQPAYDCQTFEGILGGGGGSIQTADHNIYYVLWITSSMSSGFQPGEYIFRRDFAATTGCYTDTMALQLGGGTSHFENQPEIAHKVNYTLGDLVRYYLNPSGFLRTDSDGAGGLTMAWTDLDLSSVPTDASVSNKTVVVDGDTVYWRSGTDFYFQALQSGSSAALFYSASESVAAFDVVGGQLVYSTVTGTFSVPSAGGQATLINSGGVIADSARF